MSTSSHFLLTHNTTCSMNRVLPHNTYFYNGVGRILFYSGCRAPINFLGFEVNKSTSFVQMGVVEKELLFVGCLTFQQHASVSQGRICSDKFTCCHTDTEVADQTFYLTQSQYTDTGPTGPSADPITPGAWQGSHWSANF